jgi:hypothetical protein
MTVKELIEQFVTEKLSFQDAKKKLREMGKHMNEEDFEKIDCVLESLREIKEVARGSDHDSMDHSPRPLEAIPNEYYMEIFFDCVQGITDGVYPHQIGNELYEKYGIGSGLATYFYNEALDMVRLSHLTPDQIKDIGEEYTRAKFAEMISSGALRMVSVGAGGEDGTEVV